MKRVITCTNSIEDYRGFEIHQEYGGRFTVYRSVDERYMGRYSSMSEAKSAIDEWLIVKVTDDELEELYDNNQQIDPMYSPSEVKYSYEGPIYYNGRLCMSFRDGTTAISYRQAINNLKHKAYLKLQENNEPIFIDRSKVTIDETKVEW